MLGAMAEAADHADQPLRIESHGSAGSHLPYAQHGRFSVQKQCAAVRGHEQARNDRLVIARRGRAAWAVIAFACAACATAKPAPGTLAPRQSVAQACSSQHTSDAWVTCALAHMTLRDQVAQMVWPQLYGDYVAGDAPAWRRLSSLVREQHEPPQSLRRFTTSSPCAMND